MDYELLLASARALEPCFVACAAEGEDAGREGRSAASLLPALRAIGLEGEASMYRATGGVNTHKGSVFCLGLLSAAASWDLASGRSGEGAAGDRACLLASEIVRGQGGSPATVGTGQGHGGTGRSHGELLFEALGVRGARGQAEDGYPVVRLAVLPLLRAAPAEGREGEIAAIDALLAAMRELEDSCVLHRGGLAGLALVREGAAAVLAAGGAGSAQGVKALESFDRLLCFRDLSPGGAADMLAAGLFLDRIERAAGGT